MPERHHPAAGKKCVQSQRYCRVTDLPKLVGVWPHELADTSAMGRARLVAKLKRALRQERQRGLGGHWTYDLARHSQLLAACQYEIAALAALEGHGNEKMAAHPQAASTPVA